MPAGSNYEDSTQTLGMMGLILDIGNRLVALEEGLERLETKLANLQEVNNLWDGS